MKLPIYMDYHATTPMDPRVFEAMKPYFMETFGNAASRNHSFGWEAEEAVEKSRKQIADLIGANTKEIVFTSGATESNNLALKGIAEMYAEKGNHIITAATEHKAILDTCKRLEKAGIRVTYLPVQTNGLVDLEMLKEAITDKTILISIMYANNEIGVIQPMAEIGKIAKAKGVLVHSDATQAVGKVPVNVIKDNIDLMSMSGHKIYGPKGVGALYVRIRPPTHCRTSSIPCCRPLRWQASRIHLIPWSVRCTPRAVSWCRKIGLSLANGRSHENTRCPQTCSSSLKR